MKNAHSPEANTSFFDSTLFQTFRRTLLVFVLFCEQERTKRINGLELYRNHAIFPQRKIFFCCDQILLIFSVINLIVTLQESAKEATPNLNSQPQYINIPIEIKKLIAEKRRARVKWHRNHFPEDITAYNRLSDKLKFKRDKNCSEYTMNIL